jgi:peroxiredoxin
MAAAKALGIAFRVDDETYKMYTKFGVDLEAESGRQHHLLPVPSVFILGTDGIIDFAYVNPDYKVRIEPELLLAAAKIIAEQAEPK